MPNIVRLLALVLLAANARPCLADVCPPPSPDLPLAQSGPEPQNSKQIAIEKHVQDLAMSRSYGALGLGDSNMFGWPEQSLSQALGQPTLNASIGGGTTTIIWQMRQMNWSQQSPRYVLLLTGANNLGHASCDVYWGIEAAIAAIHERFPETIIIYISILPRGDNMRENEDKINEVNSYVNKASGGKYLFVDAHDSFICNHQTPCPLYKEGNAHLMQAGYDILGQLVNRTMGVQLSR